MSIFRTEGSFEFSSTYQGAVMYWPYNEKLMSVLSLNALRWWVWAPQCAELSLWPGRMVGAANRCWSWPLLEHTYIHYNLRNLTAACYLGNSVTPRQVECEGEGEGADWGVCMCVCIFFGQLRGWWLGWGWVFTLRHMSDPFNRMPCLEARRLNTSTHTNTHTLCTLPTHPLSSSHAS